MAKGDEYKKLSVVKLIRESFQYWQEHKKLMWGSSLVMLLMSAIAQVFNWWTSSWFLPWLIVLYVLGCAFFRFIFDRKPYFEKDKMLKSLIPSTKILVIMLVSVSLVTLLPFVPLLMNNVPADVKDNYFIFLQTYMDDSGEVTLVQSVIILLLSPLIFFRPFMAWISSILGRSGLMATAWDKSRGNYVPMLMLMTVLSIPTVLWNFISDFGSWGILVSIVLNAPLLVFSNLLLAKAYSFFFLEID